MVAPDVDRQKSAYASIVEALRPYVRALLVLFAVVLCAGLIAVSRRAADAAATSDTAVIESYTLMASQGHLLVGAYSRFQWHHPGPLYFYLLAPFYMASGYKTAGLNAGAAALSIGSIFVVAVVLGRRRPALALAASATLALYAWRGSEALASPWNPHVAVLPAAALIVAAADVFAGATLMLPVVALLASLSGQAHIALLPCALILGALALGRAIRGAWTGPDAGRWSRSIAVTALVLGAVWALPLYEQFHAAPRGNLTELTRYFLHQSRNGQPLATAVSAWSDMMVGVLRPDFYVAHGWPFVESSVRWAEWLSIVELTAIGLFVVRGARRRQQFDAALGAMLLIASCVALWSATRVEERIFDHDVFWMSGIGVLSLAVTIDVLASMFRAPPVPTLRRDALVACAALAVLATAAVVRQVNDVVSRSFVPPADAQTARALASDITGYMQRDRVSRPLLKIDQDAWPIAAGAILELQKQGQIVSVEDDWVVMFTPTFRVTGHEDGVLVVALAPEHLRLTQRGARLISAHDPIYAHAVGLSGP
jgi:hypothetical protein